MLSVHDDYHLLPEDPDLEEIRLLRELLTQRQSEIITLKNAINRNLRERTEILLEISSLTNLLEQDPLETYGGYIMGFFSNEYVKTSKLAFKAQIGSQLDTVRITLKAKENEIITQRKKYQELSKQIGKTGNTIISLRQKNPPEKKSETADYSPPSITLSRSRSF
jgi:hypothetical protein